jgi:hypothetical protein
MTVSGTVETSGEPGAIEIRCYADPASSEFVEEIEAEELKKAGSGKYSFSIKVPVEEAGEAPCVLRAVPAGTTGVLAPGTATKFAGPRIAYSEVSQQQANGHTVDYDIEARTLTTLFEIDSDSECGLGPTALLSSPGLAAGAELFQCAGALYGRSPSAGRSDIQVDGRNAYDPFSANAIEESLKPSGEVPAEKVETKFDSTTGLTTIHETDPLVECKGKTVEYPETKESCEELISTGISLERTWTPSEGGRLISMSDAWESTDGAEHTISALYDEELDSDMTSPGTYQFPGSGQGFTTTKTGQSFALPAGSGTILYREDGGAEEIAGGSHPVGALIVQTALGEAVKAEAGSSETTGSSALILPYDFTVPASGTRKLSIAYAEGYTRAEVCALAETAESTCPPPVVLSTPPTTTGNSSTGTGGSSSTVTTTATTTTTGPVAHRVGAAKLVKGNIVITLACVGPSGSSCSVRTALTSIEKLRSGRPTALAARTRTVTDASSSATIAAGSTRKIMLKLNATGRALLARFHKLPLHLSVTQLGVARASASIAAQTLTILAKRH